MRTALLRLQQRQYHAYWRLASRGFSTCLPHHIIRAREGLTCSSPKRYPHEVAFHSARSFTARHASSVRSTADLIPFDDLADGGAPAGHATQKQLSYKNQNVIPRLTAAQRKDPAVWMELLDKYLPANLRYKNRNATMATEISDTDSMCGEIFKIIDSARKKVNAGTDVLAYMILKGNGKAALHVINMMLGRLVSTPSRTQNQMPSNLSWSGRSIDKLCKGPIELTTITNTSTQSSVDWTQPAEDFRYTTVMSGTYDSTMNVIWSALGSVVIQCADLPETESTEVLKYVMLILGQIHNLDLVPENVYSYRLSPLNTTIQRPPILHLVSSRVLTAISDAAWRDQQDQIIEKAASHGVSYKEIGRDPPGGRFRLKVRPLAPEVWLEFILWCCVEGGFTSAGARIVQTLRRQTEQPWFAVTWSPSNGSSHTAPTVHWDRVRARHGGSVGLIEGYSREKPFVEMPPRTISTEVVLGLVDVSIDCVTRGDRRRGNPLEIVQKNITDMVTFLEPHDLPIGYFDYLALRLLQTDAIDMENDARGLEAWYERLVFMKSLEAARPRPLSHMSYQLHSLSAQSELFAGILHQVLDGFVQAGDVHRALDAFNKLQELIDTSKLQAIDVFLHGDARSASSGSSAVNVDDPYSSARKDFVGSHGQLPSYKLAALLDLATDSNLTGFGEWLLYNDDPDSPLIPERTYESPSMARTLLRFAAISQDKNLSRKVMLVQDSRSLKPTVKLLRAKANAYISDLNFRKARQPLLNLRKARGGGCGLVNIAHLAATLLRLESHILYDLDTERDSARAFEDGQRLFHDMLSGLFDIRGGDFRQEVSGLYKQQVAALLQVFQFYPHSALASIAARYVHRYPAGNDYNLTPSIFNIIMEAVVQAKGSKEGMRLWEAFCISPMQAEASVRKNLTEADIDTGDIEYLEEETMSYPPPSGINQPPDFQAEKIHPFSDDAEQPPLSDINLPIPARNSFEPLTSGFFPAHEEAALEQDEDFEPVVIPNQRTLRAIVRQAVKEQSEEVTKPRRVYVSGTDSLNEPRSSDSMKPLEKPQELVSDVLKWAIQQFKSMGIPGHLIALDVQQPMTGLDIAQSRDRSRVTTAPKTDLSRTRGLKDRKGKGTVKRLFLGQDHTKRPLEHQGEL